MIIDKELQLIIDSNKLTKNFLTSYKSPITNKIELKAGTYLGYSIRPTDDKNIFKVYKFHPILNDYPNLDEFKGIFKTEKKAIEYIQSHFNYKKNDIYLEWTKKKT